MDIATVMGILVFTGLATTTIFFNAGAEGFAPFADMEALLITMGGTFCAMLVSYPLDRIVRIAPPE